MKKVYRPKEAVILRFMLGLMNRGNKYIFGKTGNVIQRSEWWWEVWRNNTGAHKSAAGAFVRFGWPGSGDIIGIARDGTFICIECKRDAKEKPSPNQEVFAETVRLCGGYYYLVHDMETAIAAYKDMLLKIKTTVIL